GSTRHPPRQDLLREGLHSRAGTAEIRGRAGNVPPDQGSRPALPRDPHSVRDEAPRLRRADRTGGPPHRARHRAGDARRTAARHIRPTETGRILFAFFAAMAETDRENIREATLEGLNAASRKENT